ncbi:metalloregulator ArsR/SmtB family transcription factor [Dyella sp. A6]|uniref:ArsR/SmtB family transcription factor n=1 Tax=Dyella aluminiiresistens TaxID=3069105 RepID=UPI002E760515|nr:metalloregulator ArsR/SmtB family transcription factor [Dyella sp. A6]
MQTPSSTDLSAMRERAGEASRLLKALGNPQRLRVLCLLVGQEMSVGQINEQLTDLSQSALSQHLAKLRDEGLVSTRRESQTIWYSLEHGPTEQIIATLYGIYCAPDQPPLCAPSADASRKRTGKRK